MDHQQWTADKGHVFFNDQIDANSDGGYVNARRAQGHPCPQTPQPL